jgi:hypothetical protein
MVIRAQSLKLRSEIVVDPAEVIVELALEDFGLAALEMTLLGRGLLSETTISDGQGRRLTFSILENESKRGIFHGLKSGNIHLSLPRVTVEYLQAVLLRAYRDGMAEVDHVHIETTSADLTLLFAVSAPPMSAEEAIRLLDQD